MSPSAPASTLHDRLKGNSQWPWESGNTPWQPSRPIGPHFTGINSAFGNGSIVDLVPANMLYLVDPFWNQFPPLNPLMNTILAMVIMVAGLLSVVGNFVVMYVFMTTPKLRSPSNLLVVNLAFSDFLMMISLFPFMAVSCFYETWAFGPLMCEFHGFAGCFAGFMSIWTMGAISIDRHHVIVRGIGAEPMTYKKVIGIIMFVDLFSLGWSALPLVGWNRYVLEGNMTVCGAENMSDSWFSKSWIVCTTVVIYIFPLFVIIYCYFNIVKAVFNHEKQMRDQAKKMNVESLRTTDAAKTRTEVRLAKIALMTIALWFMAWTPYTVINMRAIFDKQSVTPLFTIWGSVFAKCAAVYNPIVYGISHPRYRAALYEKFPCLACSTADDAEVKSNMTVEAGSTVGESPEVEAETIT